MQAAGRSQSADHSSTRAERLARALAHAAHVLPAQGPLSVFVHHNTLHAFEHLHFHDAVAEASRLYETEPYFGEERFRSFYAAGRITDADLEAALEAYWQVDPPAPRGPLDPRLLDRLAMRFPIEPETPAGLAWRLAEHDAGHRLRPDTPAAARVRIIARSPGCAPRRLHASWAPDDAEARATALLWATCRELPVPAGARRGAPPPSPRSHRDLLLERTGEDANDLVHPVVGRLAAAFLDDGTAAWPLPECVDGFFAAWCRLIALGGGPVPAWLAGLRDEVRGHLAAGRNATDVVLGALEDLGVQPARWDDYLTRVLLHLRGWAGLFFWFEQRPDERLRAARRVRLLDFLAVRLTYDRRAWRHLIRRHLGDGVGLASLAHDLAAPPAPRSSELHRPEHDGAWRLFQVAQLAGLATDDVARLTAADRAWVLDRLDAFDGVARRRVWQEAYEAHYRDEILHALAQNRRRPIAARTVPDPRVQLVCCIDEREESFRRHFEELDARHETFGTAGFFGLAIDYAGLDDGHPVSLCPIVVTPAHRVLEKPDTGHEEQANRRHRLRRRAHRLRHGARHASSALVRGALATPLLGAAAAVALPARIFGPGWSSRLAGNVADALLPEPRTRLAGHRDASDPVEGKALGFTLDEQIARVAATLENMGLVRSFARLVIVLGHGSISANNPHESAHDCGACGGRHGRANARLFADLANRPAVRAGLCARGIDVPDTTWFVGGMHNTSDDAVELEDLDVVPASHAPDLAEARTALDVARARSAQERCRRFDSAPKNPTPAAALRHVEARAWDLSEPRPELGHCTNAACIVGRRSLTRGLFYDRRAFLVSYDPTIDPTGAILERTLVAVGPVGAGISLEYYFSIVDQTGYGCGTKLPHNLVGLVAVMDGAQSDVRTGLPKQMVEIHEPMRLLLVAEATPRTLDAICERQPGVRTLVAHEWVQVVAVVPDTTEAWRWTPAGWVPHVAPDTPLPTAPSSHAWYAGKVDFVPPALIAAEDSLDVP
jgi:hypothetical protein